MQSADQKSVPIGLDYETPRLGGQGKYDLLILLLVTLAVRGIFALWLPTSVRSIDMKDWHFVAIQLANSNNPYASDDYQLLNWPPFWMEMLYFVMRVAIRFDWNYYACLRGALIVADLGVLAGLFHLAKLLQPKKRHFWLLFWGYCLNPLLTILTVVHGNFDAFATFWIILFLICLIRFRRGGDAVDWLLACACLGMGIFTKTFPMLLWPLLVPGFKKVGGRGRMLGGLFLVGPVFLSLGPLYVLSPAKIMGGVVQYHSLGVEFGLLSLLNLLGVPLHDLDWYGNIFSMALLGATLFLAAFLRRRDVEEDEDLVLLSAMALLAVFTVGPGYGGQYWFWVVPLLLICYGGYGRAFNAALWICAVVTIATNFFEYGVEWWLGGFLSGLLDPKRLRTISDQLLDSSKLEAMVRLPMSLTTLGLLVVGSGIVLRRLRGNPR
jgi:hypothetical protein